MMLPGRFIGNPGSGIGINLPPQFPEGRPRPEPNVPNAPPRPPSGGLSAFNLGGPQKQYTENPELNSLYNQLRFKSGIQFGMAPGPEFIQSVKDLENQIIAAGGQPYQYFDRLGREDNITSSPREGKYNPATGGFDEFGPPPSIDPSKGPFDQSRLQDAIRNEQGGRSYEDVVAAGMGGINPGGMFDDISPFQPQVITKGLDGKDYPNPGAAERANRIFLANQAANQGRRTRWR